MAKETGWSLEDRFSLDEAHVISFDNRKEMITYRKPELMKIVTLKLIHQLPAPSTDKELSYYSFAFMILFR